MITVVVVIGGLEPDLQTLGSRERQCARVSRELGEDGHPVQRSGSLVIPSARGVYTEG